MLNLFTVLNNLEKYSTENGGAPSSRASTACSAATDGRPMSNAEILRRARPRKEPATVPRGLKVYDDREAS